MNYDDELWSRLILQLQTDHAQIPALNRAQLVDDSLALALSGHLRVETALDLVSYLRAETDFIAWKAASVSLMSFADTLVSTEIYPIFKVSFERLASVVRFTFDSNSFTGQRDKQFIVAFHL